MLRRKRLWLCGKQSVYVQKTECISSSCPIRLLQLSAAGEVFLEGTCPLSRCPQTAKFPVPILLGTRRRWVRKATAFRGRSEQDRSALCPVCNTLILKTFRWNVFNGISLAEIGGHGTPCPLPQKKRKPPTIRVASAFRFRLHRRSIFQRLKQRYVIGVFQHTANRQPERQTCYLDT